MSDGTPSTRGLKSGEWRLLAVLGLPTFAYALATTVATTYLPVLAEDFTSSSTVVGLLIAIEGVMALLLAVPVGALSDRINSRMPFIIFASPVLVIALAAMGFASTLWYAVVIVIVFFAGYFIAYEPYRALYPDIIDRSIVGRAQSSQALWRGIGTITAIAAGGTLLALAKWVPFVTGAVISTIAVVLFLRVARRHAEPVRSNGVDKSLRAVLREDLPRLKATLAHEPRLRAFVTANALWEFSLGALKTFIILYLTVGLAMSTTTAGLAVAGAAVFIAIAAPVSGNLADRYGTVNIMRWALMIYGIGLTVPLLTHDTRIIAAIVPLVAFGGGVVMTLPYAIMIPLMNHGDYGLQTGLYSVSRGVGTALGPLFAGVAIELLEPRFQTTQGYQAMWGVCALAVFASIPILRALRRPQTDAS